MRRLLLSILLLAACIGAAELVLQADGATLVVPPGVADGVDVAVALDEAPPLLPPPGRLQMGPIFAFTPHGQLFDQPVTLSIPYTPSASVMPEVLRLGDDIDDVWEPVEAVAFEDGLATWSSSHFSWYGVFGPPGSQELPGDDDDSSDDDDAVDDDDSGAPIGPFAGDYVVESTEDMDAFCASYDRTTGDFTLSGGGFPDAEALGCLVEVGGTLSIELTSATDITLANLGTVGGRVFAGSNADLMTLGFPALSDIGDDMMVSNAPLLSALDLSALRSLGGVGQLLLLAGVEALDFGNLEAVGGALTVSGMPRVQELHFSSLVTVAGEVAVLDFTGLTDITYPVLESTGSDLTLRGSSQVTALDLPLLTALGGALDVTDCAGITSITAPLLQTAGTIDIDGAPSLTTLGLPSLTSTTFGRLGVDGTGLSTLSLPAAVSVAGTLAISGNDSLTVIDAPQLFLVSSLGFVGNDAMVTLGLPALDVVDGLLQVRQNDALTGFDFPSLTLVDGIFDVKENPMLSDATAQAFADSITVTGLVDIADNGADL